MNAFEATARLVLGKIWNWIIVGEEYRTPGASWEYAVATHWLLRCSILALLFGIGFFLDRWLGTSPLFLIVFFFFGVAAGIVNVVRTANAVNRDEKR